MKKRANADCVGVRGALQDLHDAGKTPQGSIADHLQSCTECAAFAAFLEGLAGELREVLDDAAARLPPPDYAAVLSRPRKKRVPGRRWALAAVAAVFVAVAIPASLLTISAMREKAAMRQTLTIFVNDLFRTPTIEKAELSREAPPTSSQALDSLLNDLASD
jgi:predicted anti-sigma-YlaC factor YlaD